MTRFSYIPSTDLVKIDGIKHIDPSQQTGLSQRFALWQKQVCICYYLLEPVLSLLSHLLWLLLVIPIIIMRDDNSNPYTGKKTRRKTWKIY